MKNFKLTLAGLFGAAVALSAAAGNPASKNVIDAEYRPLPSDWWNLVKTEPRCGTRTSSVTRRSGRTRRSRSRRTVRSASR